MARQGAPRDRTLQAIRAFWDAEAAELGGTPQVTIRDLHFRAHELHTLLASIPRTARLLDAGCGNGLGTFVLSVNAEATVGIDSSGAMLSWARRLQHDPALRSEMSAAFPSPWRLAAAGNALEFLEADVLDLRLPGPPFGALTAQRLLINLPSVAEQLTALANLRRHASDGALLVLGETTEEGYQRTDAYRGLFGLSRLERHWHNLYLEEARLAEWTQAGWNVEAVLGFDTYMLLSKVVYPAACGEENCRFLSAANAAAAQLAGVFRTRAAVEEIGPRAFFDSYVAAVTRRDEELGARIGRWVSRHAATLPDWRHLGHQRLILARAR